jgi:hypothetical protein
MRWVCTMRWGCTDPSNLDQFSAIVSLGGRAARNLYRFLFTQTQDDGIMSASPESHNCEGLHGAGCLVVKQEESGRNLSTFEFAESCSSMCTNKNNMEQMKRTIDMYAIWDFVSTILYCHWCIYYSVSLATISHRSLHRRTDGMRTSIADCCSWTTERPSLRLADVGSAFCSSSCRDQPQAFTITAMTTRSFRL